MAQWVKNVPAMQETQEMQVWYMGWEDPLEKGMATHSSILAWRIPWTEDPGGLQSRGHKQLNVTEQLLLLLLSHFSHVRLFATPWTVAHQAPPSMGFPRQEYWSGLPFPSPRDLPYPRIKPMFLMSPVLAGRFFTTSTNWEAHKKLH